MNDRQRTIGIGRESIAGRGIEAGAVHSRPDRHRRNHLASLVVGDGHHTAATTAEEPVMCGVDGHRHRLFAWRGGPSPNDRWRS